MLESPLEKAVSLQCEAAEFGFDWPEAAMVWRKLGEELAELKAARAGDERLSELGDVLFTVVNLARLLGIDPQVALDEANKRFEQRFAYVCQDAETLPPKGQPARLDAMERRWQEAKRRERIGDRSPEN